MKRTAGRTGIIVSVVVLFCAIVIYQDRFASDKTTGDKAAPTVQSSPTPPLQHASETTSTIMESREGEYRVFRNGKLTLKFENNTGKLVSIADADMSLDMQGFMVDVGYDEVYQLDLLEYGGFESLHTWELPSVKLTGSAPNEWKFNGFQTVGDAVETDIQIGTVGVKTQFTLLESDVKVSATIYSGARRLWICHIEIGHKAKNGKNRKG